jgi:hypothetical protein
MAKYDIDEELEQAGVDTSAKDQADGSGDDSAGDEPVQLGDTPDDQFEKIFEELSEKGEAVTVADLRRLPNSDKYTDLQLIQMFQEAIKPEPWTKPYKFYKDDQPLESLDGLSAAELLNMAVGYSANGKEQKKAFDELVRVAQNGHYNESVMAQLKNERNDFYQRYTKAQEELGGLQSERQKLSYALQQYAQGNAEPLAKLAQAFNEELNTPPAAESVQPDLEVERAGVQFYYENIVPATGRLAADYGVDQAALQQAIDARLQEEPAEYLTQDKLAYIFNVEFPQRLESQGFKRGGKQESQQSNAELEAVRKELATLKAELANSRNKAIKSKTPPPGGKGVTPSAGESMENVKDRRSMKEFLQS